MPQQHEIVYNTEPSEGAPLTPERFGTPLTTPKAEAPHPLSPRSESKSQAAKVDEMQALWQVNLREPTPETVDLIKTARDQKLADIQKHTQKQLDNLQEQVNIQIDDINGHLDTRLKRYSVDLEMERHQHLENIAASHTDQRNRLVRQARDMEVHVLTTALQAERLAERNQLSTAIGERQSAAQEEQEKLASLIGFKKPHS